MVTSSGATPGPYETSSATRGAPGASRHEALSSSLVELLAHSPDPRSARTGLERLAASSPGIIGRLEGTPDLAERVVEVLSASRSLTRLVISDPAAIDVLDNLSAPMFPFTPTSVRDLVHWKKLELLRVASRDLAGWDQLEKVTADLSHIADTVLDGACRISGATKGFAVIALGKLGARELNYASDVDITFVATEADDEASRLAREVMRIAGKAFKVDVNLRPEGRSGPLVRSIEAYVSYWQRWAHPWEIQALIKARASGGDHELGSLFERAASEALWRQRLSTEDIAGIRAMKMRHERETRSRGLHRREIKRGSGGIRDIEIAVQLLQLIHGREDPALRAPGTLAALEELSCAGYVDPADASLLSLAYHFLRALEHRLQLLEETQVHTLPANPEAREVLARLLGFHPAGLRSALENFDAATTRWQNAVRSIHERLFFRPLLEVYSSRKAPVLTKPFGTTEPAASRARPNATALGEEAASERLRAFGFQDVRKTRQALAELTTGLTRSSRLMQQLMPSLLEWMAASPAPDMALVGLRNLITWHHTRDVLISSFRESPQAAKRLCLIAGTSRSLTELLQHHPELISDLGQDSALAPRDLTELASLARMQISRPLEEPSGSLRRFAQREMARTAILDLFSQEDSGTIGSSNNAGRIGRLLADVADATLTTSLEMLSRERGFAVIALGRLGGREMSFGSDLDLLFVYEGPGLDAATSAGAAATALVHLLNGSAPVDRILAVDTSLRPEGHHGALARSLDSYAAYFERWSTAWEKHAYVRARPVAGDTRLAASFMELVNRWLWSSHLTAGEAREIKRMKARMERERIPIGEDPDFHLKLGRGSLSDIEWTVRLLQLRNCAPATGTIDALARLEDMGAIPANDAGILRDAWTFCNNTRNRWHLVGGYFPVLAGSTGADSLPRRANQLLHLARSLGTTPSELRREHQRVTRRARRVVERLFYDL